LNVLADGSNQHNQVPATNAAVKRITTQSWKLMTSSCNAYRAASLVQGPITEILVKLNPGKE
jgi:hypothetical protein